MALSLFVAGALGASAQEHRLAVGGAYAPGAGPLSVTSGVLLGPTGGMGELSLPAPGTVNVNPFWAVVQPTQDSSAGPFVITSDEVEPLTVPAQDASQFRRGLIVVGADDSQLAGVASSPTTDRPRLTLEPGPLSAQNPAPLPALPPNSFALGEVSIPPTGQTVTLTNYSPRTGARGGIVPVPASSSRLPAYDGEPRWHPTLGLQIGVGGAWRRAADTVLGEGHGAPGTVLAGSPAWSDLVTVTASTSGGLCAARWLGASFNGQSGADRTADWRVICDGAEVGAGYTVPLPLSGLPTRTRSAVVTSTPTAGAHTWTLQARGSVASAVVLDAAQLTVTERRG